MKYSKLARRFLAGGSADAGENAISCLRRAFESALVLVRVYYGITLYLVASRLDTWASWLVLEEISPLWPVAWVKLVGIPTTVHSITIVLLAAALLGLIFPEKRLIRFLLFVGLLEYAAFNNSFGKINHDWHGWLGISFFLIFLPDGGQKRLRGSITRMQLYLTAFRAAQALVLGFYSLSGLWKVTIGIQQLLQGEVHAFAPNALAYEIADRLLQTNSTTMIGSFIIEHPGIGWPLYTSTIYLQLFAFIVAFRPSLHRLWGVSLICFHLGSYLALAIGFPKNVLLLSLFFVGSPFVPANNSWKAILFGLPLIGWISQTLVQIFRGSKNTVAKTKV